MQQPLYDRQSSGATSITTLALTFLLSSLLFSGQTDGALRCVEDGIGAASTQVQQSVKPNFGVGGKEIQRKLSKGTTANSRNSIEQPNSSTFQRSYKEFSPIVTRWKPYRTVTAATRASPAESIRQQQQKRQQQPQANPPQRLMIPVGVSNYRPIQYINDYKPSPFPHNYFDKVMTTVANKTSPGDKNANGTASSVAAGSEVNEVKLADGFAVANENNEVEVMHPSRAHPPRFIELESSYVPLTIRFPTRTTRLNIIPNPGETSGNDLVGQDSNRHDSSFGKRTGSSSRGTSDEASSSSTSGVRNLESRVIFGDTKREEPLVLKQDGKSNIPDNMQRIIKCIFPGRWFL